MVSPIDLKTLYEQDFCQRLKETVDLLQKHQSQYLDHQNLMGAITTVARVESNARASHLGVLGVHLLQWKDQASGRSRSCRALIVGHSPRLLVALADSPRLNHSFEEVLDHHHPTARHRVLRQMGLDLEAFPPNVPLTISDRLNLDYLPD